MKRINAEELLKRAKEVQRKLYAEDYDEILSYEDLEALVKKLEEDSETGIDSGDPEWPILTCKACGMRPFHGYIPTFDTAKKWGYRYCPGCGRTYKWDKDGGNEDERDGAQGAVQVHDLPGAGAPGGAGGRGGV